jgi:signal transduction histidine kinase
MALLLDDLLDLARITQGKLQIKKTTASIVEVVDAAVEAVRPALNAKHHELSLSLPAENILLNADPLRLSQILSNLLITQCRSRAGERVYRAIAPYAPSKRPIRA